jgi:hypothetical protein
LYPAGRDHPNTFLVRMPDGTGPEVTLNLTVALEKPLAPGTPVSFEAVPETFTVGPFMLTLRVYEGKFRLDRPK